MLTADDRWQHLIAQLPLAAREHLERAAAALGLDIKTLMVFIVRYCLPGDGHQGHGRMHRAHRDRARRVRSARRAGRARYR